MSNLSPRALALSQAHGPLPIDWERVAAVVEGMAAAERSRIVSAVEAEADVLPCLEDGKVTRGIATLIRADFSYDRAEEIANG